MRSSRSAADPLDPGSKGFAHRGLHGSGAPENSLAAFRAAVAFGAGIECDVRLSADGQVMVVHDHDLQRLCGSPLTVEGSKADVIAARRLLGTEETVPWLSELLDEVEGRAPILVELKTCGGNAFALAKAVAADLADYAGPVGVMSFDPQVGWWFARHVPYRRRGLVVKARWSPLQRWARIFAASPHFLAVDRRLLVSPWAERARSARTLYSWTISTAEDRKQASVHADALIWEADGRP
jgi:glycerophosphoryl diester phosphodiesterase